MPKENENLDQQDDLDQQDEFEQEFNKIADDKDGVDDVDLNDDSADETEDGDKEKAQDGEPGDDDGEAGKDKEDDPYAGMDPAVAERLKKLEEENQTLQHRIKSDDGRVNAYQRKVNELTQQLAKVGRQAGGDQPSQKEIADAMGDEGKWDAFKEEYSDVAEAIESWFDARLNQEKQEINNVIAPVVQDHQKRSEAAAYDSVAEEYPTWQDDVRTPEFSDWLNRQPAVVQSLAASDDVADATSLIGLYDNHRIANGQPSLKRDPVNKEGVEQGKQEDSVAARRERQLNDGVSTPSKSARVDPNTEGTDTFEQAFNAYAARKESRRQA